MTSRTRRCAAPVDATRRGAGCGARQARPRARSTRGRREPAPRPADQSAPAAGRPGVDRVTETEAGRSRDHDGNDDDPGREAGDENTRRGAESYAHADPIPTAHRGPAYPGCPAARSL